jgi:hypothetical protein
MFSADWFIPCRGVAADFGAGHASFASGRAGSTVIPSAGLGISIDTTPVATTITPVATTICHLISEGTAEQALLVVVAQAFPDLTPTELSEALQAGTEQAERQAARRH